jgi:hypothetical protein
LRGKLWLSFVVLMMFLEGKQAVAQVPAGSGPTAKEEQASGMTLNTSFNGSVASGSDVYDWTATIGYIFNKHFSADVGVPILFVRGTMRSTVHRLCKNPTFSFHWG